MTDLEHLVKELQEKVEAHDKKIQYLEMIIGYSLEEGAHLPDEFDKQEKLEMLYEEIE